MDHVVIFRHRANREGRGSGLSLNMHGSKGPDGKIGLNSEEGEFTGFIIKLPLI